MRLPLSILKPVALAAALACQTSSVLADAQPIQWNALRPSDQSTATMPLPGMAISRSQGETLAWHDEGRMVELTGFILPIDQDGDLVYEFMLVPWAGACSHSAPPPPNQLVHVVSDEPFRMSRVYEVITVTGSLRPGLDKAQLFIMDGVRVLDYGYSMSSAKVTRVTGLPDPDLRSISPLGVVAR
ncbi:hypothetical protein EDE05_105260 [Neorhizobium sp. R1-B]|uniref:DUF3299 domain-containing protein n=1 Tax=unclassified Neorhizobium TaxID=2629175 RepID=UPI00104EAA69|nr:MULTISPECIES: DUF3299 domain-containing protein [unclassified Neorhizobium]TCV71975.1 hypothetical protein EDE09_10545 [Neorhizobium sp. S3-V5DH]TDX85235.1 hypothetical protein EDE05_105260 [Neorhizobium sp. R1-B]